MRAIVTCECCSFRQTVARHIRRPEEFYVVCHECESVLHVSVSQENLEAARASTKAEAAAA